MKFLAKENSQTMLLIYTKHWNNRGGKKESTIEKLKEFGVERLNLGGGVREEDSLDQFKRRFGGEPLKGQVLKQVFDKEKYDYLRKTYCSEKFKNSDYFPPYWIDF